MNPDWKIWNSRTSMHTNFSQFRWKWVKSISVPILDIHLSKMWALRTSNTMFRTNPLKQRAIMLFGATSKFRPTHVLLFLLFTYIAEESDFFLFNIKYVYFLFYTQFSFKDPNIISTYRCMNMGVLEIWYTTWKLSFCQKFMLMV